ncbi:DUF6680 family protein [Paraburkholderia solitsugae]|nr:DUF6680 family protein [Paraburkholderia solitsugae]
METKDWVTVGATIAGPILAVQAQKWVERARAAAQRKDWVFSTLMATRQARVSPDHVRALNMIDLAYYGTRIPLIGWVWRTKREKQVLTAWHDYHAHLNLPPERRPKNEAEQNNWNGRSDELLTNLLDCIATANNFRFERNQLKGGSYSPEAHNTVELQGQAIRHLAIEVLAGNKPLPMEVKAWPVDAAAAEQQRNTQAELVQTQTELVQNQREMMGDFKQILERLTDRAVGPQ